VESAIHDGWSTIGIICKTPRPGASKTRLCRLSVPSRGRACGAFLADMRSHRTVPEGWVAPVRGLCARGIGAELRRCSRYFGLLCRCDATLGLLLWRPAAPRRGHDCVVLVNADADSAAAVVALRLPHCVPRDRVCSVGDRWRYY